MTSSVAGLRCSKALPKAKLAPRKRVMVTVWLSAATLIHYSFLRPGEIITSEKHAQQINEIPWKLQLLQPQYWSMERLHFSRIKPDHRSHNVLCCAKLLQLCPFFVIPWTVARKAPLSMGFSRQGYWSGLPFPPPGDLPDPRIKPASLKSPTLADRFFITRTKSHTENTSKFERIGPWSFASSSIFTWLLTISTAFCRENVSTTSRTQKICLRVHWILKYGFVCVLSRFSHVWLCATLWTAVHQAPLSMGFSR